VLDVSDCLLVVKERQVVSKQARYDRTHSLLQTDVVRPVATFRQEEAVASSFLVV